MNQKLVDEIYRTGLSFVQAFGLQEGGGKRFLPMAFLLMEKGLSILGLDKEYYVSMIDTTIGASECLGELCGLTIRKKIG